MKLIRSTVVGKLALLIVCVAALGAFGNNDPYIQSDGANTVNLGYFASKKTKIEVDFQFAELVKTYRAIMNDRMATPALRTGTLRLSAIGADVVLVERQIAGGRDAFGAPAEDGFRALAVNRCGELRRIEYGGRVCEIPPESAVWLKPAPEKKKKAPAEKWAK